MIDTIQCREVETTEGENLGRVVGIVALVSTREVLHACKHPLETTRGIDAIEATRKNNTIEATRGIDALEATTGICAMEATGAAVGGIQQRH